MGLLYRVIFAKVFDTLYLGHLPEVVNEEAEASDVSFVLQGLSNLSQNLIPGGSSSSTPARLLDKDLAKYESRANDYCIKIMKEAAVGLPAGSKPVLSPPDPLSFWNVQVCLLYRVIFANYHDLFFRRILTSTTPCSLKYVKIFFVLSVRVFRVRGCLASLGS